MGAEAFIQHDVAVAWGSHPRVRFARINTGVGWFCNGQPARKTDPGAYPVRFNPKGTADLVGIIAPQGQMLMIEIKSATGRQTKEQQTMQRVVTAFGGVYICARSVADVDAAFALLGLHR